MLLHQCWVQPLLAAALAHSSGVKLSALEPQQLSKPAAYESVLEAAAEEEITIVKWTADYCRTCRAAQAAAAAALPAARGAASTGRRSGVR